jgi:hypothetical protein
VEPTFQLELHFASISMIRVYLLGVNHSSAPFPEEVVLALGQNSLWGQLVFERELS